MELLLTVPAALPCPLPVWPDAARLGMLSTCFGCFGAAARHQLPDVYCKGRAVKLHLLSLERGAFLSVLLLSLPFTKLLSTLVCRPQSLNEPEIDVIWVEAEMANLVGLHKLLHNERSTMKFVPASICAYCKASQWRTGSLIVIVAGQNSKTSASTERGVSHSEKQNLALRN